MPPDYMHIIPTSW